MFDKIGTGELIIILIIALFVIGPNKLPEVAKSFGKVVGSARKYLKDVTDEVKEEMKDVTGDLEELKGGLQEAEKSLKDSLADEPGQEPKALAAGSEAEAASSEASVPEEGPGASVTTENPANFEPRAEASSPAEEAAAGDTPAEAVSAI